MLAKPPTGVQTRCMRGLTILLVVALGCGDDDAMPMLDGGMDAMPDASVLEPPMLPEPAAEANLLADGACPEGWTLIADEGLPAFCEPYPDGFDDCDDHEAHFLGEEFCRSVGTSCASGFPSIPEGVTRAVYVEEGADGDGTESSPFGTIAEAIESASSGDAILVAAGTYEEENLSLNRPVTIRGACAAATQIIATTPADDGAIVDVFATDVVIEDLQMRGPRHGIVVQRDGSATVRGVALVDLAEASLATFGELVVEDVVARITNDRIGGFLNVGVGADGPDARLTVRNSVFRGHLDLSAQVLAANATFEDSVLGAHFIGLIPTGGRGLEAASGATVEVRRTLFDVNAEIGALAADEGTSLLLEDTYLAEIVGDIGSSVAVIDGASTTLRRTLIAESIPAGIVVTRGGQLVAEDVFIAFPGADDQEGYGLQASTEGTRVEMTRVTVIAAFTVGMSVNEGAEAVLTDIQILDGGSGGDYGEEDFAFGLIFLSGSRGTLQRVLLENNEIYGLAISESEVTGSDVSVIATFSHPLTAAGGALWLDESPLQLDRLFLDLNQNISLVAFGERSVATIRDLTLQETFRAGCVDRGCESFIGGVGMGIYDSAAVDVTNFQIADNELIGAQVAFGADEMGNPFPVGGTLNLNNGTVSGNLIGINVQIEDYDFDRFSGVAFDNNERNFDSTLMAVPTPPTVTD